MYLTHLVSNIKTTSNQCYTLYVTLLRILIHTEEKPYDKSVHTGGEPYIYDFIIVRLINNLLHKNNPLSNLFITVGFKGIANLMLNSSLFILFCETDADFYQIATFIL